MRPSIKTRIFRRWAFPAGGGEVDSQRQFAFEYRLQVIESNAQEFFER